MPLSVILADAQSRSKDSYAASSAVGLCVRANGEEPVMVIDGRGNIYRAGINSPTVAPVVTDDGAGTLTHEYWAAYAYVYATSRFPFVESDLAVNGKLYPRSNASPITTYQYIGAGARKTDGTVTKTTEIGIDKIWLFRTPLFATQAEAQTAGEAGQLFFLSEIANNGIAGTATWTDNNLVSSFDQIQSDNYAAAQFQYVEYYDPYWWGFGNNTLRAIAAWTNTGPGGVARIVCLNGLTEDGQIFGGNDSWVGTGRDGQNISFNGITTGGFDGNGTYRFKFIPVAGVVAAYYAATIDGTTPVALPIESLGAAVTIQGPATTLYRSKARNPFSWGFTQTIGEVNVPQQYAFKVGGGLGTAIKVIPNNATLKLDCEFPAKCYTLNLRAAGSASFENTLRVISDVYSVSSHHSQFAAVTQSGQTVLWGVDFKNFCIVQCDGNSQIPISSPIPKLMRGLSTNRARQLLTHGVYDPRTELNCIWVPTANAITMVNYLIFQHAPTGFWGTSLEHDILCSATIQDTLTGATKTFIGTESGFLGQALVKGVYSNWLPDSGLFFGTCSLATADSITTAPVAEEFNTEQDGLVGNWCLVTDPDGKQEQWARICNCNLSGHTITFDLIRPYIGGVITAFNPVPAVGWKFYIGIIEARLLKFLDFNLPQTDKQLLELWLTQENVDPATAGTLIRYYRERENTYKQFATLQNKYDDAADSNTSFVNQDIPSELVKMFGIEIINRGYAQWRFLSMVLKTRANP